MEDRAKRIGGLIAGAGVGAAAASALRRRWSGRPPEDPSSPPGEVGARLLDRLAEAVRIPTVSYEDRSIVDLAAFDRLHAFLAEAYPLVHERLAREVVAGHTLLYTWEGSDPELPGVLLLAHQDVVPVEPGTEEEWSHDPFGGTIDGEYLWGRGSLDDKIALIAILEAVEGLLADGFEPRATLYLGFGDDEETGGLEGGRAIARHLGDRGTTLRLVLDEGGAVVEDLLPGAREAIALLGIGEKGYVNLEVTARAEGGHPSAPPASSAIGLVAEAVRKIEGNPMPPRMAVQHGLLRAIARLMPLPQRMLLRRPRTFGGILAGRLAASPTTNALIRTTMAPTIIEGGVKPNMLPQQARAVVNVRIMPGDTIETVVDHVRSVVGADVAVTAVEEGFRGDPPPVSDPDGDAFRLVAETVGDLFGVGVAPWILTAATDSRHFTDLAPGGVLRFAPITVNPQDLGRVHGTDERFRVADADRAVGFYGRLVRSACG